MCWAVNDLYGLTNLIPTIVLPSLEITNWSTERLSHMIRVTQVIKGRTGFWTQVVWLQSLNYYYYYCYYYYYYFHHHLHRRTCLLILDKGEGGRGRNTDVREKYRSFVSHVYTNWNQTDNPGMCPGQGSNLWPSSLWNNTPTNWGTLARAELELLPHYHISLSKYSRNEYFNVCWVTECMPTEWIPV